MRKFQLALYDADPDNHFRRFTGRVFRDTPRDREIMRLTVEYFNKLASVTPGPPLCLGIFDAKLRRKAAHQ